MFYGTVRPRCAAQRRERNIEDPRRREAARPSEETKLQLDE